MPLRPLALTLLLATAPVLAAREPAPVKLAAPGLNLVRVSKEVGTFYIDHFAQRLSSASIRVVTASEIEALVGLERQRQLLGCAESSTSCLVEVSNALGVDGIISGSLAEVGGDLQLNLKILSAQDGRVLSSHSALVNSEKALLANLNVAADRMAREVVTALRGSAAAAALGPAPSAGSLRQWAWLPAAGGLVLAGVGGALLVEANSKYGRLTGGDGSGPLLPDTALRDQRDAETLAAAGARDQVLGYVGVSLGAAALVGAGAMFFLGDAAPQGARVVPMPNGLALVGVWP